MRGNNLLKYFTKKEFLELKNYRSDILRASMIVITIFKDKKDKAGKPYIYHLHRVSSSLTNDIEMIAGLLHDTIEDTEITYNDLLEVGFSKEVLEVVKLVTNEKIDKTEMSREEKLKLYSDKIDAIINSGNIHAVNVKCADMEDNYDPARLKELPIETQEWFHEKYGKQLVKLRKVREGRKSYDRY